MDLERRLEESEAAREGLEQLHIDLQAELRRGRDERVAIKNHEAVLLAKASDDLKLYRQELEVFKKMEKKLAKYSAICKHMEASLIRDYDNEEETRHDLLHWGMDDTHDDMLAELTQYCPHLVEYFGYLCTKVRKGEAAARALKQETKTAHDAQQHEAALNEVFRADMERCDDVISSMDLLHTGYKARISELETALQNKGAADVALQKVRECLITYPGGLVALFEAIGYNSGVDRSQPSYATAAAAGGGGGGGAAAAGDDASGGISRAASSKYAYSNNFERQRKAKHQPQQQVGGSYNPKYPHPGGNSNPHQPQQQEGSNGNGSGNGSGSHYPPNGGIGGYNYPPGNGNGSPSRSSSNSKPGSTLHLLVGAGDERRLACISDDDLPVIVSRVMTHNAESVRRIPQLQSRIAAMSQQLEEQVRTREKHVEKISQLEWRVQHYEGKKASDEHRLRAALTDSVAQVEQQNQFVLQLEEQLRTTNSSVHEREVNIRRLQRTLARGLAAAGQAPGEDMNFEDLIDIAHNALAYGGGGGTHYPPTVHKNSLGHEMTTSPTLNFPDTPTRQQQAHSTGSDTSSSRRLAMSALSTTMAEAVYPPSTHTHALDADRDLMKTRRALARVGASADAGPDVDKKLKAAFQRISAMREQ
jgi:hypothetical protein